MLRQLGSWRWWHCSEPGCKKSATALWRDAGSKIVEPLCDLCVEARLVGVALSSHKPTTGDTHAEMQGVRLP